MREYTYDELQKMQEKALERVRNMQMYSKKRRRGRKCAKRRGQEVCAKSCAAAHRTGEDTATQKRAHQNAFKFARGTGFGVPEL